MSSLLGRFAFVTVVLVAAAGAPARAEIVDRLDVQAEEIDCPKWPAGQPTQLAKLRGRVVVLHFSDPERITAQAALPTLRKLATAWKDAPLTVVEIVTSPIEAVANDYAAKELPPWAVGWDGKGITSARYPGTSMPRTYLIGPDGRIVFHAHVQAFTKEIVGGQVERVQFFDPSPDLKRAKGVAKAAAEMRYAAALAEAAKAEAAKDATDADRALCKAVQAEVERTWSIQTKVLDALVKVNDWGIAWRRAERIKELFRGTSHQADAEKIVADLAARPIVPHVVGVQKEFDGLVEEASKARTKKALEEVLGRVRRFAETNENNKPGERAATLVQDLERRLAELAAK